MLSFAITKTDNHAYAGVVPFAIVFEGDSISSTAYHANNYTAQFATAFSVTYPEKIVNNQNLAVSGSTQANLVTRAAAADAAQTLNVFNIFHLLIGANDISSTYSGPGGSGPTGWLADLALYLDNRGAAGYTHRLLATVLPRDNADFLSVRGAINTTIRSWVGVHCEGIVDFAADPVMGTDAACTNTNLYDAGLHPTDVGYGVMSHVLHHAVHKMVNQ